jgi:hypothetical protein
MRIEDLNRLMVSENANIKKLATVIGRNLGEFNPTI